MAERVHELATLDIRDFDGRTMTDRWIKMFEYCQQAQLMAGKRFRSQTQGCIFLIRAIETLRAFQHFNFHKLRHSLHALDVAVQAQLRKMDRLLEDRERIQR